MIAAGWFAPIAAAYLGAANLAGYLAGALSGRFLEMRYGAVPILRAMMLVTGLSFAACAFHNLGFAWFFGWRFASGVTGGVIMVLAGPLVLAGVPATKRGLAGGLIFTGVGVGIVASGTLVPALVGTGPLEIVWLALAVAILALTAASWAGWPNPRAAQAPSHDQGAPVTSNAVLLALTVEYGLNACGLVPHMLFVVDYVARGLGRGLAEGGAFWVAFGLGASAGPLLAGRVADRLGFRRALRSAFLLQILGVGLAAVTTDRVGLLVSTAIAGASAPGVVPLVLGRVRELAGSAPLQQRFWTYSTIAFAVAQAAAGYGYSYLFGAVGSYRLLFGLGAAALALALALDLLAGAVARRSPGLHPEHSG